MYLFDLLTLKLNSQYEIRVQSSDQLTVESKVQPD